MKQAGDTGKDRGRSGYAKNTPRNGPPGANCDDMPWQGARPQDLGAQTLSLRVEGRAGQDLCLVHLAQDRDVDTVAGAGHPDLYIGQRKRAAHRIAVGAGTDLPHRRTVGEKDRFAPLASAIVASIAICTSLSRAGLSRTAR